MDAQTDNELFGADKDKYSGLEAALQNPEICREE